MITHHAKKLSISNAVFLGPVYLLIVQPSSAGLSAIVAAWPP
jgi:hypothetical protein